MRQAKLGGKCSECAKESSDGLFWFSPYKVLDQSMGLVENSMKPELCDHCKRVLSAQEYQRIFGRSL